MSDQQQRTQWALDLFREFIVAWTPAAMREQLLGSEKRSAHGVREAIKAIAPKDDGVATVGWAVFKREHDTDYDRERPSGYVHTIASAVFEDIAQADNAQAYRAARNDGEYIICEIREIP